MKRIIHALILSVVSLTANAATVQLLRHNLTSSSGAVSSMVTDGSSVFPVNAGSNAIWNWDGTTLTSTGVYRAVWHLGSDPLNDSFWMDEITDLSIDTSNGDVSGSTAYNCVVGNMDLISFFDPCSGMDTGDGAGPNEIIESTVTYSGLTYTFTLGGDDDHTDGVKTIFNSYNFDHASWDGTTLVIGNGIAVGSQGAFGGGEAMVFQTVPVPAAVWLFGSALGLLGWMRRK